MLNLDRLARHSQNTAFTEAVLAATQPHPFNRNLVYVPEHNCCLELTDGFRDGEMTLGFIQSLERKEGNGGRCLYWLLDLCHEHGILLHIYCETQSCYPYVNGMTQRELKSWYRRKGFVFPANGRDGYYYAASVE